MPLRWTFLLPFAFLIGIAASWLLSRPEPPPDLLAQTFTDLEGRPVRLKRWQGRVLLINFWATWCSPCRMEVPLLGRWQQRYGDRGLQVVGVAVDEPEAVRHFLKEHRVSYPILIGGGETVLLMERLGNRVGALPFTVVLDREGRIALRHNGTLFEELFRRTISPLLAQEPGDRTIRSNLKPEWD